jgi:hypothetical protein
MGEKLHTRIEGGIEMIPTGSHFPNHCSDCIFSQAAKDLYGAEYALWCVRYDIPVSKWRDACQFWQKDPDIFVDTE